ncbi:hypothetical protein F5Y01DRAFT_329754 [Xylaria sp. FL0043]|nr:hypothetical protein F5Y01DRAFT_329754 [Xylaria sp. FL0043]
MSDEELRVPLKSETPPHRQLIMTSGSSKDFAWTKCSDMGVHKRLSTKEHSLEDGLHCCKKLINTIEDIFSNIAKHNKQSAELIWPLEDRTEWIDRCRGIIRDHEHFKVPVGVAGETGSGKTSVLNALLGFQELLPTSNEEAATAVQCKVSFNHDPRPEYSFRCIITFQNREALEAKLEQFFNDLKLRDEVQEVHNGTIQDEDALRDIERMLLPPREMINVVFGLQDGEAENLGLDGVLKSKPQVMELLGTVRKLHSSNADEISRAMKPYMDSTIADHKKSGADFAMWPLIERVELFLKSDILRNGVTLVDLPGLGDAVQSRASVAERAFDKLTATLIVSQATRAADNLTAVNLMSKHQEMAMMLNGKFHQQSFCVCLSQIDQIDRKAALRKPDAMENTELQSLLAEEESEKLKIRANLQERKEQNIEKQRLRREQRNLPATLRANFKAAQKALNAQIAKLSRQIIVSRRRLIELDSKITFTCIRARNKFLRERIEQDFQKRQARLVTKSPEMQKIYNGQVSVCPTSSKAFWKCKCPMGRMAGFPGESYTGIPGLQREEHVDGLLNRLEAQLKDTPITKASFEEHVLADVLRDVEKDLEVYWSFLTSEVSKMNPLTGKKEVILSKCPEICADAVRGWGYRRPDDKASDKMHWTTYQANLHRLGGKFVSKSKQARQEYNWMEDVSHIMFNTIVNDWNKSLNHDIPSLAHGVWRAIDKIWEDFTANLNRSVRRAEPRLVPELTNETRRLENIKMSAKDRVRAALKQISLDAAGFYPRVVNKIQSMWEQVFKAALDIKGQGSYIARQELVLRSARRSQKMFSHAYNDLQSQLQACFGRLCRELKSITKFITKSLKRYFGVLLDNVLEPTDLAAISAAVSEERLRLQQSIAAELAKWAREWQFSGLDIDVDENESCQIPEAYQRAQAELEQLEDEDYESDSDLEPEWNLHPESVFIYRPRRPAECKNHAPLEYLQHSPLNGAIDQIHPSEPDQAGVEQREHLGLAHGVGRDGDSDDEGVPVDDGEDNEYEPYVPPKQSIYGQEVLAVDLEALAQNFGGEEAGDAEPDRSGPAQGSQE